MELKRSKEYISNVRQTYWKAEIGVNKLGKRGDETSRC